MQRDIQSQSTLLTVLIRVYGLLLYAYPTRFRREYGGWMLQVFRDQARTRLQEESTAVIIHFLVQSFFDFLKTVFIEHIEELFSIKLEARTMSYQETISELAENPEGLERLYQEAIKAGHQKAFQQAIDYNYEYTSNNLLLAGWYHRLHFAAEQAKRFLIEWRWVLPLAILNGLLFWWLTDRQQFMIHLVGGPNQPNNFFPIAFILGAPLTALFILIYFTLVGKKDWRLTAVSAAIPLFAGAYVYFTSPQAGVRPFQGQYLQLGLIHVPLLAWVSVGLFFLVRHRDAASRLRFLLKSIEIIVVGGIIVGVLFAFFGITIGLFDALDVTFSDSLIRLIFGGGLGILLIIAPVIIYNPTLPPDEQSFPQGIYRFVSAVMQVLLPLTFLVLIIYIAFIPANFQAPFDNRDVLITYNIMLFAVIGLLVGATLLRPVDSEPQRDRWLRRLIIGVTILTLVVSLYALSAIIFRTVNDRITPNRLTIIGWNIINIGLLVLLLLMQWRANASQWLEGLYQSFSIGTAVYALWVAIVIFAIPWLFGVNETEVENLPYEIQVIIYSEPNPTLLKCRRSPHIYLLDNAEKRWIADIETFNERGYLWRDINFVTCLNLRDIPLGTPIPEDAGPIPQPLE